MLNHAKIQTVLFRKALLLALLIPVYSGLMAQTRS